MVTFKKGEWYVEMDFVVGVGGADVLLRYTGGICACCEGADGYAEGDGGSH